MSALTNTTQAFKVRSNRAHSPGVPNWRIRPAAANEAESGDKAPRTLRQERKPRTGPRHDIRLEPTTAERGRDLSPERAIDSLRLSFHVEPIASSLRTPQRQIASQPLRDSGSDSARRQRLSTAHPKHPRTRGDVLRSTARKIPAASTWRSSGASQAPDLASLSGEMPMDDAQCLDSIGLDTPSLIRMIALDAGLDGLTCGLPAFPAFEWSSPSRGVGTYNLTPQRNFPWEAHGR